MADTAGAGKHRLPSLRSCRRCNQKKIRCNKAQPCDSCVKSSTDCTFPGPGRAPRRRKRALKAELVSRLRGLEQELRLLTDGDRGSSCENVPPRATENLRDDQHKPGRLVVSESSTQYVTHEILVNLENQIDERKHLMSSPNEGKDSEDTLPSNDVTLRKGNQFLFGFSSMASSLEAFHPSLPQSQTLWNVYQENVAPVVMIFHQPTLFKVIYKAASNASHIDRASEAVVFAVYFAAVNSMGTQQCTEKFSRDRSSLREYYKFATEQALARAGFLQSRSLEVLQATVLFLTCLRSPEDADFVWTMTAAVHRMAQGLGLHRDGTLFGLSPFEIEMRRRLWWHIYLLDIQSSELHAIDTQITEKYQ